MFMYVQLRARHRAGPGFALLLMFGTAAVVASQISFLALVWAEWERTMTFTWRLWWVTMVISVLITHLVMLEAATARRCLQVTYLLMFRSSCIWVCITIPLFQFCVPAAS